MKKYEWYLFDLDNTILDFSEVSKIAFEKLMSSYEMSGFKNPHNIFSKINQDYWDKYESGQIEAAELKKGRFVDFINAINLNADADFLSTRYFELILEHSKEIENSLHALSHFKSQGKLAIITNGLSDLQHLRIEKHKLGDYFDHVFISDEMKVSKPSGAFFEQVHDKIGIPSKENVLVLGDNPISDIEGGKNYGFDTFFFNYRKNRNHQVKADYEISNWKDVFSL